MRYNWLPWKFILRRMARTGGFIDPVALLAQFNKFAQPSEVMAPVELLRAGVVFHARGLINARTIQGNLDWIWPFWVRKQFEPYDSAFVPRSFALTHVNITNRNWTAVGLPDCAAYPIVDPRGLVTPYLDGWSLDAWIVTENDDALLPPNSPAPQQIQLMEPDRLAVETEFRLHHMVLHSVVDVAADHGVPVCRIRYTGLSKRGGALVIALRPFNPEGISFVYRVSVDDRRRQWSINGTAADVFFDPPMDRHVVSEYRQGDVYTGLLQREDQVRKRCEIGMASAAAIYHLQPDEPTSVSLEIPLDKDPETGKFPVVKNPNTSWQAALDQVGRLQIPDPKMMTVYNAAVYTLILLAPLEIYPGPYYYKRFWFRDAAFILHALLSLGLFDRAERAIDHSLNRQTLGGYFESQKGEWDSNGQVLWVFQRFSELTGKPVPPSWMKAARKGARWLMNKRLPADADSLEAGLLPAGFSAEHLGNNDFYYWDNFWGIAGLQAAAAMSRRAGQSEQAEIYVRAAKHFALCVERSLLRSSHIRRLDAVPASPYRRMDAGAIGSVIAGYPLKLWTPKEPRLLNTLDFLIDNCFIDNAFFQDMTHSGFNIYLTLHCAQCLLRADDPRYLPMVEKAADLASPTGHWPEAVHPQTMGGCMGDGQHAWAAAEWIMMIHNMFAAEEGDTLVLMQGIPSKWLKPGQSIEIGPMHTRFGVLEITAHPTDKTVELSWTAQWRKPPAELIVRLPGAAPVRWDDPGATSGRLSVSQPLA